VPDIERVELGEVSALLPYQSSECTIASYELERGALAFTTRSNRTTCCTRKQSYDAFAPASQQLVEERRERDASTSAEYTPGP